MALNENDKVESIPLASLKDAEESSSSAPSLPAPVSSSPAKPKWKIPAPVIVPVWMAFSVTVILYNNHLYNDLDFKFPVFLVTWHLTFSVRQIYGWRVSLTVS